MKSLIALLAVACIAFGLAACGDDSSSEDAGSAGTSGGSAETVSIDVGLDEPIVVDKGKPKIGMLIPGETTEWLRVYIESAQARAEERGVDLEVVSADWDVQRQLGQMQNAIQSRKYDAWITATIDSNVECNAATRDPAAAGIVVSLVVLPACGRDLEPIDGVWSPGTLNMVNGQENIDYKRGFLKAVSAELTGSHKIAVLFGPELNQSTKAMRQALRELLAERRDLEVVTTANTDFTSPDALAKTQSLLQAHDEIDTVISVYSDITRGVIQAIKSSGREGEIQVFDQGGSKYSASQVAAGTLTATTEYDAIDSGKASVDSLIAAFAGEDAGPRFVDTQSYGSVTEPHLITRENIGEYRADY